MTEPAPAPPDEPNEAADLGQAYAALIGQQEWQLDVAEPAEPSAELGARSAEPPAHPTEEATAPSSEFRAPSSEEPPPPPARLIEAMLFAGGQPLTPERAADVVRGLSLDQFRAAIDELNRTYRRQGRPYAIRGGVGGFVLTVLPAYRGVRDRLFGTPREARLSQPALDVLALVAYRQPVGREELDSLRGSDSGPVLRQLQRLGLVAMAQRGDAGNHEVLFGTTPRFLELFGLRGLDDLPQIGDWERL